MPLPLFLRPSRSSLPRFPPGIAPSSFSSHSWLLLPPPSPTLSPCSYVIPTTTLYPGPLSISPHGTFSSSPFFLGTRRRLSLYRILSSTGAPYEARVALRSPRELINECFTLYSFSGGRPVCLRARARSVLPLSTMFSVHSVFHPFLSSLAFTSEPVFRQQFPFPTSSNTWMRLSRFLRNSESRLTSRIFLFFFFILFFFSFFWISL